MAQRLGVRALWAAYGSHRVPEHQTLVAAVAHWSGADVDDERTASLQCVTPDATLHTAGELLDVVTALPVAMPNEALPQTVEHVGIYADMSVGLRLGLVSLYVVLPRLRRGVALTEKS
jgi:hypothetical protein